MDAWLKAAVDYIPDWLDYQMRKTGQPGCAIAIAHKGRVILEKAFGVADISSGRALTPRHRLRAASHSKSFTAAGVMKLREAGVLRLDDPAGRYVDGLHASVAETTLAQLLSHSAGMIRDGAAAGQFLDRRPFVSERELRADLAEPLTLEPSTRFKYSNHAFGLVGLVVEAVTGSPTASGSRARSLLRAGCARPRPTYRRHEAHRGRAGTRASCRSGAGLSYPATTRPMPSRPPAASFRPQPTSHASSRASIRRRNEACSRPQAVAR